MSEHSERFILDIEWSDDSMPIGIVLRRMNIDRHGYYVAEFHGDNLDRLLRAAVKKISAECA